MLVGASVLLGAVVFAQGVSDTGSDRASVALQLGATVPESLWLRLDATEVPFDLRGDTIGSETLTCLRGTNSSDELTGTVDPLTGVQKVLPLGTSYSVNSWPALEVMGSSPVESYPPLSQSTSQLWVERSDYFMCYQSFVLDAFSSASAWQLSVERTNVPDARPIESLYIGNSGCQSVAGPQGLSPLAADQAVLLSAHDTSYAACRENLIVLAVKVGTVGAGEFTARLTYTLMNTNFDNARNRP